MRQTFRNLFKLFLCGVVVASLATRPVDSLGASYPTRSGVFRLRIESDKAVYRAGQLIRLRITFINNTDHYLYYRWMPVWGLCGLFVHDEQGHLLISKGNRGGFLASGGAAQFKPHEVLVADFGDPETGYDTRSQWARLDYWGYDLDEPGVYTIMAFPTVAAWEAGDKPDSVGPEFLTSPSDKSNSVRIQIVK